MAKKKKKNTEKVSHIDRMYQQVLTWDKVLVPSHDALAKVLDWSEGKIGSILTGWNLPLNQGHIDMPGPDGRTDAIVMFQQNEEDEDLINLMEYDFKGNLFWLGKFDTALSKSTNMVVHDFHYPESSFRFGKNRLHERMETIVQIFVSLMGYIQENRNTHTITETDKVKRRVSENPITSNRQAPTGNRVVKIEPRTIYRITGQHSTGEPSGSKRQYQAESWTVIGHKRRYRNDKGEVIKEIDVAPYTKGKGQHKPKTYQI